MVTSSEEQGHKESEQSEEERHSEVKKSQRRRRKDGRRTGRGGGMERKTPFFQSFVHQEQTEVGREASE